ncbi:MAG: YrrS family protein [Bacillaceae bacterium]|nr:YrrS family protein [Bacillaceae bacterium]
MRGDHDYGYSARSQKRKRKKTDRFLNIAIGVVIFLILFVGGQLLLGGGFNFFSKTEKVDHQLTVEDLEVNEETEDEQEGEDTINDGSEIESSIPSEEPVEVDELGNGEWQPIGTVQEEPFTAIYDKDHINWAEMEEAFRYATGLSEDEMITWRIRNGGDHQSAIGTVSNHANKNKPYKVRIEWVTNKGWMPVEVEVLEENPYL